MTAASASATERAEHKVHTMEAIEDKVKGMPQSTEDFFTRDDRRELYKQSFQNEEILKDLDAVKLAAEKSSNKQADAMAGHESRIRALENSQLKFQTQVKTSWWWVLLISGIGSAVVNVAIKLLLK